MDDGNAQDETSKGSTPISDSAGERIRIAAEELGEAVGYVDIATLLLTGLKPEEVNQPARDAILASLGKLLDRTATITDVLEGKPR